MIFDSMWPLALLLAVPAVIILYLLKPKGKDYRISSNLLWEKVFKNQQSKTFLEKFVHNILMYLEILAILLLVTALMSPYIRRQGMTKGNVILVIDASGSMQHDAGDGKSRIKHALDEAKNLIAASDDTAFSIITSGIDTELLAVAAKEKSGLYGALDAITCCDGAGNLKDAESMVDTLRGAGEDADAASVIVFTDAIGAEDADGFVEYFGAQVFVMGEAVDNVANNFLSCVTGEEGTIAAASLTNYSGAPAAFEISLYEGDKLVQLMEVRLDADETRLCYFDVFDWNKEPLKSEISSVQFEGKGTADSLAEDNTAYAVLARAGEIDAALIGEGNIYLEKAFAAAAGKSLPRVADSSAAEETAVHIYDANTKSEVRTDVSRMVFADGGNAEGIEQNVMLTVSDCDLTAGLAPFSIGVNETQIYDVPQWADGFLWAGEKCAGYYGQQDGRKVIVLGFDVRESDFPLKAEFPVFVANALGFLADTSLLAGTVYEAGEPVVFHPQADIDVGALEADTAKAGLYEVQTPEGSEYYVVRFATESQSDGRRTAAGSEGSDSGGRQLVKKRLRNIFLVLAILLLLVEWIIYVRQLRYRGKFYLGVRLCLFAMLFLALLNVSVSRPEGANTTIFLVDISNSNAQNLEEMEQEVRHALSTMPKDNRYGIVTFGKNSLVEQFLTEENHFSNIMSTPDKTATNFEEAVSRALAMIPADGAGRIVVLTDGKETKGDITGTASAIVSRGIELLARTYETTAGADAYIDDVKLPSYLYQGDAYTMTVTVESSYDTDAELFIWMGTEKTAAYAVHLNKGTNQFKFRQNVSGESVESFRVELAAPGDTCAENDSFHACAVVDSMPKVLLVSGMEENSAEFEALLSAAGINYRTVSARNVPDTLDGLLEYKSVILENVYLSDLAEGFLDNIETYVKDYGCGLVCCGGEDSFALGGYRDTVLERVLPVDMQLRGVNENPPMAMIMVIDHSGSMSMDLGSGATNLDLAVTAAEAAVDALGSRDYVGVLTFDDKYSWLVKPTLCSDKQAIKAEIEKVAEGGGTTIKPALKEALLAAKSCDAGIRHVILLTDGQGETRDYRDVTDAYNAADVTLSTVAVGDGADHSLLRRVADACGGRSYVSDMATEIPKIFAQEVFMSGDTYLQNGTFALSVNGGNEITRGLFEDGWPMLYGYVSATPKHSATRLIASEKDDPVLTVMQYGLGHTVAWNTDVTNQWTAGFAGLSDYAQLWKRVIGYSAGNAGLGEDSVDVFTAAGATNVTYRAVDYGEDTKVEAVYTDPKGNTETVPLKAAAPGQYEAKLETDLTGLYNLSVRRLDSGEIVSAVTTAATVQYSDEYKFGVSPAAFTDFVEHYGRMLGADEDFWVKRKSGARERYELAGLLILLAILWFVMDIALRRFHVLPQDFGLYRRICLRWEARRSGRRARAGAEGSFQKPGNSMGQREEAAAGKSKASVETSASAGREGEGAAAAADSHKDFGRGNPMGESQAADAAGGTGTGGRTERKGKRNKKTEKAAAQSLDTSALLKKKDQRQQ